MKPRQLFWNGLVNFVFGMLACSLVLVAEAESEKRAFAAVIVGMITLLSSIIMMLYGNEFRWARSPIRHTVFISLITAIVAVYLANGMNNADWQHPAAFFLVLALMWPAAFVPLISPIIRVVELGLEDTFELRSGYESF